MAFAVALVPTLLLSGCSWIRGAAASSARATLGSIAAAVLENPDPEVVRAGLPSFLLVLDGLAKSDPENHEILLQASELYLSYTQAFVGSDDPESAARATGLYERARDYALRALAAEGAPLPLERTTPLARFESALADLDAEHAVAAHAAAAAWLGRIVADVESMASLAELPQALALARRALELDDQYGGGRLHLAFGVFYAVQPPGIGQDLARSRHHFDRAAEIAGPDVLLPRVLRAEFVARAELDEATFTSTLEEVLAASSDDAPSHRLANSLARQRARELLAKRDDLF
ncbi:MAG: TRAP transporter TatT component family protein [Planctomycetota bacterium]